MSEIKNNFRFWVPLDSITKAKDADGNEVMKMGGIASTKSRDTDNEILDPAGFDLSYLRNRGVCNWNHDKSPESVIGEPTLAEVRKEGLYVETMLYPDSKKAQEVYKLAETLKKSKGTRRLGFSIEGKATQRDPIDSSHVTGATITGIALTISPKNPDSIVDIIKGNYHGWGDEEVPPVDGDTEFDLANGGKQFIIDIVRPDGMRVTVDHNYNIEVHKAMSAASASGQAVTHEHVDGETKDQMNGNLKKSETEIIDQTDLDLEKSETDEESYLTQEDVIQKIIAADSVISFEKAHEIFNVLNKLTMANKTKITDDLLNKSLEALDLMKGKAGAIDDNSNKTKVNRNGSGDGVDDEGESQEDETLDVLDQKELLAGKDNSKKKNKVSTKSTISKGTRGGKSSDMDDDDEGEGNEEMNTDEDTHKKFMKKSDNSEVLKAIAGQNDLIKSLAIIAKAGYDLAKAQSDELAELRSEIAEFGEAPVTQGRKSISKSVERDFQKSTSGEDTFEKSNDGKIVVDVSRARAQVLNMFDTMAFKNNAYNEHYGQAMRLFEASGIINPDIQKGLENEFGVKLMRP